MKLPRVPLSELGKLLLNSAEKKEIVNAIQSAIKGKIKTVNISKETSELIAQLKNKL